MRAKPWYAKIGMKCVLDIDMINAREALKCAIRCEMRANN